MTKKNHDVIVKAYLNKDEYEKLCSLSRATGVSKSKVIRLLITMCSLRKLRLPITRSLSVSFVPWVTTLISFWLLLEQEAGTIRKKFLLFSLPCLKRKTKSSVSLLQKRMKCHGSNSYMADKGKAS